MQSEEKLGTGNIWKLMISMGIPIMISQIVNILYSIVDRIYVGRIKDVGENALAGLGLTMPVIIVISAFAAFARGRRGAACRDSNWGKGDKKRAEKILGNSFFMILVFSVVLMAVFYIVKKAFPVSYRCIRCNICICG